ncbi:MAG TPA: MaoC family dehydratase N-terminal domain-containing protein [Solirubrobacteraceae bacterium]|nr:MaoC family dehydratase N-terminal domain-containing protein [Solirubrobacteraceae bacterium]
MSEFPSAWSQPFNLPVERGKIAEIARAAGLFDRAYVDDPRPFAPPAFFYGATYLFGSTWERPGDTALADAPIDPQRLLHAEEEVTFPGPPPRAGDELTGRVRLESVTEKTSRSTGRTLRFVTATTEFRDSDGALAATSRTTAVEELAE